MSYMLDEFWASEGATRVDAFGELDKVVGGEFVPLTWVIVKLKRYFTCPILTGAE